VAPLGWRHRHPNERHVQFAYRGRRRNHKHCQPVGRPPRYLRARTRRERLPGLPDLGADQCGVPGCDWRRSNTNPKCNSDYNSYSNGNSDCNANRDTHGNTNGYSNGDIYSNCNTYRNINTKADADTKVNADR
jgi:hypothetical protein